MIIVDSNIFIFAEGKNAPEQNAAISKLKEASIRGRLGINVIVASEVFHRLQYLLGSAEATVRVSRIVSDPGTDYLEFAADSIKRAMALARDFNLKINDALIAQQAIDTGASVLTDNVKDFGRIKTVRVIPLRSS